MQDSFEDLVHDVAANALLQGNLRYCLGRIAILMAGDLGAELACVPWDWTLCHEAAHALIAFYEGQKPGAIGVFAAPTANGTAGFNCGHFQNLDQARERITAPNDSRQVEIIATTMVQHGYRDPRPGIERGITRFLRRHRSQFYELTKLLRQAGGGETDELFISAEKVEEIIAAIFQGPSQSPEMAVWKDDGLAAAVD